MTESAIEGFPGGAVVPVVRLCVLSIVQLVSARQAVFKLPHPLSVLLDIQQRNRGFMPTLYEKLQHVKSEEDVKDVYIQALGLKKFTKGLIDIRTKEMWFEAKHHGRESSYKMFTQLLHYVQDGLNKGSELPPFLAVMDTEKAALMKTADVIPFLKKKTIKWGKSATKFPPEALNQVSAFIGSRMVSFRMETHEAEFISTVKAALKTGDIVRTQITPDNLKQVFDKWVAMIGREIDGAPEDQYALLFFADIMHDGTVATHDNLPAELLHQNNAPVFNLSGKIYKLGSKEGYRQFWAIYHARRIKPTATTFWSGATP
jgi:hypothetical protein